MKACFSHCPGLTMVTGYLVEKTRLRIEVDGARIESKIRIQTVGQMEVQKETFLDSDAQFFGHDHHLPPKAHSHCP